MLASTLSIVTDLIHEAANPLTGSSSDYDSLLAHIGEAHFVLLGEASHGTHEFYRERATITTPIPALASGDSALRVNSGVTLALWGMPFQSSEV